MKRIFLAAMFLVAINCAFAQSKVDLSTTELNSNWILYQELNDVNIYYQKAQAEFDDAFKPVFVLLKIVNKTSDGKQLTWNYKFYYDNKLLEFAPDDLKGSAYVPANEALVGKCTFDSQLKLSYLVGESAEMSTITQFELEDIVVE